MGKKLTKAQRLMLQIAADFGGTARIFPDQFGVATGLEAMGLMAGNGKHFHRESTITPAGRKALAEAGERNG